MAKQQSQFKDAPTEVIQDNLFKENPIGLPDDSGIVLSTYIPEMKRIQFMNGRDPGCALDFHYCSKTHPLKHYQLFHGFEHDLPVEVIDHLEAISIPNYAYRKSAQGYPEMYIKSVSYIYQCKAVKKKVA